MTYAHAHDGPHGPGQARVQHDVIGLPIRREQIARLGEQRGARGIRQAQGVVKHELHKPAQHEVAVLVQDAQLVPTGVGAAHDLQVRAELFGRARGDLAHERSGAAGAVAVEAVGDHAHALGQRVGAHAEELVLAQVEALGKSQATLGEHATRTGDAPDEGTGVLGEQDVRVEPLEARVAAGQVVEQPHRGVLLVDGLGAVDEQVGVVGGEALHDARGRLGRQAIVGVQETDHRRTRGSHAAVARARDAQVRLVDHADARVGGRVLVQDLARAVGRAVVDAHDLDVFQ